MNWLAQWAFVHFLTGSYLQFWSGPGSDIGEYTVATGVFLGVAHAMRSRNCEVHKCWRMKRRTTAAGHHVCHKHHPDGKLSAEDVVAAHKAALSCSPLWASDCRRSS